MNIDLLKKNEYLIYTDGACRGNPGIGGYGIVIITKDENGSIIVKKIKKAYKNTTNNKMELEAVIVALKNIKNKSNIYIFSDSKYVVDAINKNWLSNWIKTDFRRGKKDEVKNINLWEELIQLLRFHEVSFNWVKGHNGDEYNECCDKLANEAMDELVDV